MESQQDLAGQITEEIAKAIRKLGGDPSPVILTDTWQVNRVLGKAELSLVKRRCPKTEQRSSQV